MTVVDFAVPPALEAHEPPEARGLPRDGVRLLVGTRGGAVSHHQFSELPSLVRAGDVLVVNTSATIPAAVEVVDRDGLVVHFATPYPSADLAWLVELRAEDGRAPYPDGGAAEHYPLPGGGGVILRAPYSNGRLWIAGVRTGTAVDVRAYLHRFGRPIRYSYLDRPWPLRYYQTIFATDPGSAEMPSAGRPFTDRMITRLVTAGVLIVPVLLHAGVASPEAHERPFPERFRVPAATARTINHARANEGRIIAVGTTVVRALESAADGPGMVRPVQGWTDLVVTPQAGTRVVDGLLTGFHEPRASHLDLVTAIAGTDLLADCYKAATQQGYLWHEFGDVNLILP